MMKILNFEFRISISGSATAFLMKRPTPPEFHQSKIKDRQSKIDSLPGGER